MDKIYPPSKFICSESIPLKDYFEDFSNVVKISDEPPMFINGSEKLQNDIILNRMGIRHKPERNEIVKKCSLDLLTVPGEGHIGPISANDIHDKDTALLPLPEAAHNLNTVKVRLAYYDKFVRLYEKSKTKRNIGSLNTGIELKNDHPNFEAGKEFAVSVRVYHPFQLDYNNLRYQNLRFSQEIVVLSSNTLADLRDKILCSSDAGICSEVQYPNEDGVTRVNSKANYTSGFIFIDNVFYNDNRPECDVDYSEVILAWAKERGIGPLQVGTLHMTRIDELTPHLGYPYVYQHQGKCEHVMIFSDAWLVTNRNSRCSDQYPYNSDLSRFYSRLCLMCCTQYARWICLECDRLPHNKMFLCKDCLLSYCYKGREKIGHFKVFPFFDRALLF